MRLKELSKVLNSTGYTEFPFAVMHEVRSWTKNKEDIAL